MSGAATTWLPIESAPHGKEGLLYVTGLGVRFGKICHYQNPDETVAYIQGANGRWDVTHWMPLPEPPVAGGERQ